MTSTPIYEKGKLYDISIIDFRRDPDQPRKYFDPASSFGKKVNPVLPQR